MRRRDVLLAGFCLPFLAACGRDEDAVRVDLSRREEPVLRQLPRAVYDHLDRVDLVFHAGDVLTADLLDDLRAFAPVHAVLGNNDRDLVGILPETIEVTVDGVRIAMIHDAGPRAGRERRLHRRFPAADLVVFGHSHLPWDGEGVDGQRLLNPGSPTWRRLAPAHTVGRVEVDDGILTGHAIVPV